MKQTAVEWLRQELLKRDMDILIKDLFEKAKEMHKQEIIDAWVNGNDNEPKEVSEDFANEYYNEIFKKY
jgi:hypothetical protein